ncbi:MAG: hypothetical protein A3J74_00880 [Elusimicrobia bacterium RIFCSPHIGHO2_02_FULL_57_9]|nr:MAG: hypothetical protein A3J74_00880 [Elusimicrobia bacterium RIFCSPHIGHO2_02_FULL_57_9]
MSSLSQMSRALMLAGLQIGAYSLPCRAASFSAATNLNDETIRMIPAVPQPAAGQWYTDPAFGTKIYRLTDSSNADSSTVPYAYWPIWSKDGDMLWVCRFAGGNLGSCIKMLWDWAKDAATNMRNLQSGGTDLNPEGLIWSRVTNNKLWGCSSGDLNLYSLAAEGASVPEVNLTSRIRTGPDFGPATPSATGFWQMSMDGADRYFAWTLLPVSLNRFAVYDRTLNLLYVRDYSARGLDEVHLTRDGAYLVITPLTGVNRGLLWDFASNPTSPYNDKDFTVTIAHEDFGPNTHLVAANAPEVSGHYAVWDLRNFANGTKTADQASAFICNIKHQTATAAWPSGHWSWQNLSDADAPPQPAYFSFYVGSDQTGAWRPFFDEIWKVWTDGSTPRGTYGKYRRLAHHRTRTWGNSNSYRSAPKGSVSPTGRYFAWSSNWENAATIGGQPRVDVYILKIPTEAEFAAGNYGGSDSIAPAAPKNLRSQ